MKTVRLNESKLREIISESIKRSLKEFWLDDEAYYIGTDGYNLETGELESLNGMDNNEETYESADEALDTIKYICTYPKNSSEWDLRYANNIIPLWFIVLGDERIDNKLYMSRIDAKYLNTIKRLTNDEIAVF